ncbi:liver-expressed antimicrobial peptide 2-like [Grus americana]|uniref:liver-expressed antimicrobial peptide 2-like n=1 Tax=Grus americana TaxID=9117 RepID=UPI002408250D|nr:liver-expressed antimicrobial peptide 2-like [Grus americana]
MAASAPVAPGTSRGGWASGTPSASLVTTTSLALLLSLLLLLPSSLQELRGAGGHAAPRLPRMTPFWRMVGSRPLGAHCRHSLECVTKACRAGRCAPPQYEC